MTMKILISRTDKIGDVILTLPILGLIKQNIKNSHICFLGQNYTKPVIDMCEHVDSFIDWQSLEKLSNAEQIAFIKSFKFDAIIHVFPNKKITRLAKLANIPLRIGTLNRIYHWLSCNKMVKLSRKNSELHEAALNAKLLAPLISDFSFDEKNLWHHYGCTKIEQLSEQYKTLIDPNKFNLIIHPKSFGSAREWPANSFCEVIKSLPQDKFKIFITGSKQEQDFIEKNFASCANKFTPMAGKLSLPELIAFIAAADGLVAASTGPLHISAALGRYALGLYPPIKPMHGERWGPLGKNASFLSVSQVCKTCKNPSQCKCMMDINPNIVVQKILDWKENDKRFQ